MDVKKLGFKEISMVFNGAQIHILVNHLPVIAMVLSVPALILAILINSLDIKRFVLGFTVIAGLSALPAFWTGEPAEDTVEKLPGVGENWIEAHEESAELATVLGVLTALAAGGALAAQIRRKESLKTTVPVVCVLALVTSAFLGNAAHQGGLIRHTELRSGNQQSLEGQNSETTDDD
jgi:hypothetical protein